MSSKSALVPQCSSCMRRWLSSSLSSTPLHQQQRRNAHKTAKAIPVMLVKPVDGYGRPGTIVPVPRPFMRDVMYPRGQARYIVGEELKALRGKQHLVARDNQFTEAGWLEQQVTDQQKAEAEEKAEPEPQPTFSRAEKATIPIMGPDHSVGLLDTFLPSNLEFNRPANVLKADPNTGRIPIFGSVTIDHVEKLVRSLVSHNDEAARINLAQADIEFVNPPQGDDKLRVKHLGSYEVEIGIKGSEKKVRRTVTINLEAAEEAVASQAKRPSLSL